MADVITELFALQGSAQPAGGNTPLPLVDPGAVWLVTEGHIDVVALTISREGGTADLQRTHLLRIETGEFLFGLHAHPEGHNVLIMGYGSPDACVARLPVELFGCIRSIPSRGWSRELKAVRRGRREPSTWDLAAPRLYS